jgi:hypothetical protein
MAAVREPTARSYELSHPAITPLLAALPTLARVESGHLTAGGDEGNQRLTVLTGAVLIVLLAVLGVTILRLHTTLLWVHLFLGLLLIGPVVLKLSSTATGSCAQSGRRMVGRTARIGATRERVVPAGLSSWRAHSPRGSCWRCC